VPELVPKGISRQVPSQPSAARPLASSKAYTLGPERVNWPLRSSLAHTICAAALSNASRSQRRMTSLYRSSGANEPHAVHPDRTSDVRTGA
jgi:hypothetical protein